MAYPKPIPHFTPKQFAKTLKKAKEATVSEEQKNRVNKLREQMD